MAELTPEEKDWLVKFCMESEENTGLALRIGEIQPDLEKAILGSFFEELSESIGGRSQDAQSGSHWKPGEISQSGNEVGFTIAMKEYQIELTLWCQGRHKAFYVAVPAACTACPQADRVQPHLEDMGLRLQTSDERWYLWWFYPTEEHKWVKHLAPLHDAQVKHEKVEYFTNLLVHTAEAICKALDSQELEE